MRFFKNAVNCKYVAEIIASAFLFFGYIIWCKIKYANLSFLLGDILVFSVITALIFGIFFRKVAFIKNIIKLPELLFIVFSLSFLIKAALFYYEYSKIDYPETALKALAMGEELPAPTDEKSWEYFKIINDMKSFLDGSHIVYMQYQKSIELIKLRHVLDPETIAYSSSAPKIIGDAQKNLLALGKMIDDFYTNFPRELEASPLDSGFKSEFKKSWGSRASSDYAIYKNYIDVNNRILIDIQQIYNLTREDMVSYDSVNNQLIFNSQNDLNMYNSLLANIKVLSLQDEDVSKKLKFLNHEGQEVRNSLLSSS